MNNNTCDLISGVCKGGCDAGVYVTTDASMCNAGKYKIHDTLKLLKAGPLLNWAIIPVF